MRTYLDSLGAAGTVTVKALDQFCTRLWRQGGRRVAARNVCLGHVLGELVPVGCLVPLALRLPLCG